MDIRSDAREHIEDLKLLHNSLILELDNNPKCNKKI